MIQSPKDVQEVGSPTSITIGVTTYNNASQINRLLDGLLIAAERGVPVHIYDDASSDTTVQQINEHPIALLPNFRLSQAASNSGGPLPGRKAIARTCGTEYVTFIDGDDELDAEAFFEYLGRLPSGQDMILTPYMLSGKVVDLPFADEVIPIDSRTITLLVSGVGGRIYRANRFVESCPSYYVPRAEDAHVNMRVLLSEEHDCSLYHLAGNPFYIIHAGTKSRSTRRITKDELEKRVGLYRQLRSRYGLNNEYLLRSRAFLMSILSEDRTLSYQERMEKREQILSTLSLDVKRIVFLCNDPSVVGGVSSRVNLAMKYSAGRPVQYLVVSLQNRNNLSDPNYYSAQDGHKLQQALESWDRTDTVIVVQAAILRSFPKGIRSKLESFPIVYYGDAQLAALLQTKAFYQERSFFEQFRASALLTLTEDDAIFQRQLGIHGQKITSLPVAQQKTNGYQVTTSPTIGYVGVSDFRFKATDRLVDVAFAVKRAGLPPLNVFTSAAPNSPDIQKFIKLISERGIDSHCRIIINETEKERIYRNMSVLLVPSRNEAGGTVILEAMSYGVPVAGLSYAPALKKTVVDGINGFLFDHFDADLIVDRIAGTSPEEFRQLSDAAFETHTRYSPDRHLSDIEQSARDALENFTGRNEIQVFPILPATDPRTNAGAQVKSAVKKKSKGLKRFLQKMRNSIVKRLPLRA